MTDASGPTALLRSLQSVAGRPAHLATLAAALGGLLAVAAAQLIATAVDRIVFAGAGFEATLPTLVILAVLTMARAAASWTTERAAFEAAAAVRLHLFRHVLDRLAERGPTKLAGQPAGELAVTITEAIDAVGPLWRSWKPGVVRAAVVPLAVLVVVAPRDPLAAIILVLALPLLVWFSILAGKGAEEASGRQWASLARLGGHLLDQVRGLGELKLAGTSQAAVASVAHAAKAYGRETMAVLRLAFLSALAVEFVATGAIAGVAVAVGFRLLWGELDFATGFFVLLLAPEFFAPLRDIGLRRHARLEAMTALGTLAPWLAAAKPSGHRPWTETAAPAIRFEAVRVVHDDGRVALDGFDLHIAAGEHVALVGSSGAGKSTLFALLARFIEPTSGRILVNGEPLADIDVQQWRRALVSMPQAPQFFDGSIADNIVMGRAAPGASREAAVHDALCAAGADAIMARLPQGLATPLAERGQNLSGGEAQRLALARAFFAAGPLVLFDEPTSHLDAEAQAAVLHGLAALRQGRTVLTIAHRLETVTSADRIVLIEDGRVIAQGAPQPMLERIKARVAQPPAERSDA